MDTVISVQNLYKQFKVYNDVFTDRLKEIVFFWNRTKYFTYFTALSDININIKKGEVIGLIGPNGSGKTTLLKILSSITYPTSGKVCVNGSIVAILSLGLGFNPRFTGRENIVIGGAILGMSLMEIKEKENWIIEFSELKDFIDQPIRTYSSGMWARLSFSVAAAVSPDILIIDEALATGDGFFVQKSLGRIHDICKSGTTSIFVSHNLMQIQRLCSERVILLEKGSIINDDKAYMVIDQYNDLLYKYREEEAIKRRSRIIDNSLKSKEFVGNGDVIIEKAYFTDTNNDVIATAVTGHKINLNLHYVARKKIKVRLAIQVQNYSGICAFAFQTDKMLNLDKNEFINKNFVFKKGTGKIVISFNPLLLTTNVYLFSVYITNPDKWQDVNADFLDFIIFQKENILELSVLKRNDFDETRIYEQPATYKIFEH